MKTNEVVQIILEASGGYDPYNPHTAYSEADRAKLQSELQTAFPFVNVNRSTLGGENKASLLVTVSMDKREKWPNNILENSRYAKFHLSDRKLECISGGRVSQGWAKLRKSVVRDADHAATKIIAWATGLNTGLKEGTDKAEKKKVCPKCHGLGYFGEPDWSQGDEVTDDGWGQAARSVKICKRCNGLGNLKESSDFPGLGLAGAIGEILSYEWPSLPELAKLILKYPKFFVTNAIKDFKTWRNDPTVTIEYLGSQGIADFYRYRCSRGATIDNVVASPRGYGTPNSRTVRSLRTVVTFKDWDKWKKKNLTIRESNEADPSATKIHLKDKTHKGCGGIFQETSIHDDWDGVLHCTKCNKEVWSRQPSRHSYNR